VTEWHEKTDLPWCKVYEKWWTSDSHLHLGGVTLAVGLRMMSIANRRGRRPDGSGAVLGGDGLALNVASISRAARVDRRLVKRAIDELLSCGTIEERDGIIVFPKLRAWQETDSAGRMRRHRERNSDATVTADVTDRRSDDRGKKERSEIPPRVREAKPSAENPDAFDIVFRHVVDHWNSKAGLTPMEANPDMAWQERNGFLANMAERAPESVYAYIDAVAASPWCRGEVNKRGSFSWTFSHAFGSAERIASVEGGRYAQREPRGSTPREDRTLVGRFKARAAEARRAQSGASQDARVIDITPVGFLTEGGKTDEKT
jgi:hypothetical protein